MARNLYRLKRPVLEIGSGIRFNIVTYFFTNWFLNSRQIHECVKEKLGFFQLRINEEKLLSTVMDWLVMSENQTSDT